jgi:hypothetical protein
VTCGLFLDEILAALDLVILSPRHDRHRRRGILRRAFDQTVGIDHIDQHSALCVAATHDLHLFQEKRAAFAKHIVALRELRLEADRADLPASERNVRNLFGDAQPSLDAAPFGHGEVAGDAFHVRVVEAVGGKLVVRRQQLEHRRTLEDQIRLVRRFTWRGRKTCDRQQQQQRDEGTSYHYLPASEYSEADVRLTALARAALSAAGMSVCVGASWTTDAPFRETREAIATASRAGIFAVEMEAAELYAFAKARGRSVVCFAHVTNQMGRIEEDFEKGMSAGTEVSLRVISLTADRWREANASSQTVVGETPNIVARLQGRRRQPD